MQTKHVSQIKEFSQGELQDNATTHRRKVRELELELVLQHLAPNSTVLEIGAGAGWQAARLSERGHTVLAVDVVECNYKGARIWPVQEYDGFTLPFADKTVDAVFSSNVLEHIPHVEQFQTEIQRVLKTGGTALHVMPSGTWRFWTSVTFYLKRLKQSLKILVGEHPDSVKEASDIERRGVDAKPAGKLAKLHRYAFPARHGETGSAVSELYLFSRVRWCRLFKRSGWKVEQVRMNQIFYSGTKFFGSRLSMSLRRKLSYIFGSSCILYILSRSDEAAHIE